MSKDIQNYPFEVIKAIMMTICDVISGVLVGVLCVFPWRLCGEMKRVWRERGVERIAVLVEIVEETMADGACLVPFLMVFGTVYRFPGLVLALVTHSPSHWRHLITTEAISILTDLPTILRLLIITLTVLRLPLLLSRLLPAGNFLSRLRPDPRIYAKSIPEVSVVCVQELCLLVVLLPEMILLELTVHRYPLHFSGILFSLDPNEVWDEVNSRVGLLLLDIPYLVLCVLVTPFFWRSVYLWKPLRKGELTYSTLLHEIRYSLYDLLLLPFLLLLYLTFIRIPYYQTTFSAYKRTHSIDVARYFSVLFSNIQLFLDVIYTPCFLLLILFPWTIPGTYREVLRENEPGKQRQVALKSLFKGGVDLVHVGLLVGAGVVAPWLLLSYRTFRDLDWETYRKIRLISVISFFEIVNLTCFLLGSISFIHIKSAFKAFFTPIQGQNYPEIATYMEKRRSALLYYSISSLFLYISLLFQSIMLLTLWRIPTIYHVISHFPDVLPEFKQELGQKRGKNALLIRVKFVDYAIGGSVLLFKEWVNDLPYLFFVFLTPIWRLFLWYKQVNSSPFSLKMQKMHRKALVWSSRTGCLDILSLFATILILLTAWKIPFFVKLLRKNRHFGGNLEGKREFLSYHFCVLVTFREWMKDVFFLPLGILLFLISPWRIPQIISIFIGNIDRIPTIKAHKSIKSNRFSLLKMAISVIFFDYPALVMGVVLVGTLWRALVTLNLVKIYAEKEWKQENETDSTLFREILGQFVQLVVDAVEGLLIVLVLVCGVRTRHLYRRMRRYLLLYRDRKGYQSQAILTSWFGSRPPPPQLTGLCSLSKNTLWEICTYLDLPDIGNMQVTCHHFSRSLDYKPIWRYHYLRFYHQFLSKATFKRVIQSEFHYKSLVIEAYREYRKTGRQLTEEERDYLLGLRAVVLEESVLTVLSLPDLVLLPGKGLAWGLYCLPYEWYADRNRRWLRGNCDAGVLVGPYVTYASWASSIVNYHPEYRFLFSKVHYNLFDQFAFIFFFIIESLTTLTLLPDLFMLKTLSCNRYFRPLNQPITGLPPREPPYFPLFQVLQVLYMCLSSSLKLLLLLYPVYHSYTTTNSSLMRCITGQMYENVVIWVVIYSNLSTLDHLQHHFPYYMPIITVKTGLNCAFRNFNAFYNSYQFRFGKFQKILRNLGVFLLNQLQKVLIFASESLTEIFHLILQNIRASSGNLLKKYCLILYFLGRKLRPFGVLGDLVFSPFTVVWMLWPVAIPYYYQEPLYYVLSAALCLIFIVKGYKTAQEAWKRD